MAPVMSSSMALPSDASNPSIPERVIRHQWEGTKYKRADGNFSHWTDTLKDALILNGLYAYVFESTIVRPDAEVEPRAHVNWGLNDRLAITFIKSALDDGEHRDLVTDKGAKQCFEDLKTRTQWEGPIKQIALLQEALSTYCSLSEPLPTTAGHVADIIKRAFDIGEVNQDLFTCIALLNSLNDPSFEALQNSVSTLISNSLRDTPCDPNAIRLLMENAQNIINAKAKSSHATALSARGGGRYRDTDLPGHNHGPGAMCCKNCLALKLPCRGHSKQFCVQKGGGMAGKSVADAQAAQTAHRASKSKAKTPSVTLPAAEKTFVAVTGLDGKMWYVDPTQLGQLPAPQDVTPFAGIASTALEPGQHTTEVWEHAGFMAQVEENLTNINWDQHATAIDERIMAADVSPVNQQKCNPITSTENIPFLVDSSATIHISPCREDFQTLRPIAPRVVKGLGGSSVSAIGIGTIHLHIAKGADIVLEDVFYIPNATVRLISVSLLAARSNLDSIFDHKSV